MVCGEIYLCLQFEVSEFPTFFQITMSDCTQCPAGPHSPLNKINSIQTFSKNFIFLSSSCLNKINSVQAFSKNFISLSY